jgi:hypothetical protein
VTTARPASPHASRTADAPPDARLISSSDTCVRARGRAARLSAWRSFAINKHHEEFVIDEGGDGGHKRSMSSLMAWLKANGYQTDRIWQQIKALIVKTMLAVQPHLSHVYHSLCGDDNVGFTCFEILGFDVLLDRKAKPWLLEASAPHTTTHTTPHTPHHTHHTTHTTPHTTPHRLHPRLHGV